MFLVGIIVFVLFVLFIIRPQGIKQQTDAYRAARSQRQQDKQNYRDHTPQPPQLNSQKAPVLQAGDKQCHTETYNCLSSTCSTTTTHRTTIPRQHAHSITPLDSHSNRTTQLRHQLIMRPQSHLFSAGSEDMTK